MDNKEQIEEKEINKKGKKKIVSISLVLILLIAIIGISYAAYTYVFTGGTNTLSTSDISLEFLESNSNIINLTNALPMGCREGKQQEETFDFSVTSKTTRDVNIKYTLSIQKLAVDSGYTAFTDDQIAVYLTDFNDKVLLSNNNNINYSNNNLVNNVNKSYQMINLAESSCKYVTIDRLNNYELYNGTHKHDSTHQTVQDKFKLRVWIAQSVDASSWNANTKLQYKFKIKLTSEEKEKSNYVYRYGTDEVHHYQNLAAGTYNGYCAINTNEEYNSCTDDNSGFIEQQDCLTTMSELGATTCEPGSWTVSQSIPYTNDVTTLNKQSYLAYTLGSQTEVLESYACYVLNNDEYCLKGGDTSAYSDNVSILQESFGELKCSVDSDYVSCSASGLFAYVELDGNVGVISDSFRCKVNDLGLSYCKEL